MTKIDPSASAGDIDPALAAAPDDAAPDDTTTDDTTPDDTTTGGHGAGTGGYDDGGYDGDDDGTYEAAPPGVSRRVRITALVLTLLGLADSTYLTVAHFTTNLLSVTCAANSVINCQKVTTSPQSVILHIPVAILGLAFYTALTVINLPVMWRSTDVRIAWLRLAMIVSGIGFVFYLIYAELFLIKAICEYCTGVHLITLALFILIVVTLPKMVQRPVVEWDGEWDDENADPGGAPS